MTINSILNIYENFQSSPTGEIIHSLEYKISEKYRNKNVCIVGFGNTASDIASELTKVSKQVFVLPIIGQQLIIIKSYFCVLLYYIILQFL